MPSNHLVLCQPPLLLSVFPSIRVFSNESALCIRQPNYQSFSISPSSEYPGLISFRIDWFDLLVVHGTLRRVFSSTTIWKCLQRSAFFMVQLSHLYLTTGKTIALTRQNFVSKVMSLLFNTLPRFVIAFLPRSKYLLIPQLQSPSTVIFGVQENSLSLFLLFPHLFAIKWWDWMPWSKFSECWVLSQLFDSPLSPSSRGSLVPICFLGH